MTLPAHATRLDWVDIAKGICIILVVMMHATLGVEKAAGSQTWLHAFIEWARPFRMPDFFLISGLFLAARIDRPWRAYLDTKVIHFAYFYVLWMTIQFAVKSPALIANDGLADTLAAYFLGFVDPFGTLWFIYLLALFFVAAKLVRDVPKGIVLLFAATLHIAAPATGSIVVDEFTGKFVFFYTGYALAPFVFQYAERISRWSSASMGLALVAWAVLNAAAVTVGIAFVRGPDLVFSYIGIAAVVVMSVLLARTAAGTTLANFGRQSIVIYLAFTLFMAPTRILLLKVTGGQELELVALASTVAGVLGSLLLYRAVSGTRLDVLFVRPAAVRLSSPQGPIAVRTRLARSAG